MKRQCKLAGEIGVPMNEDVGTLDDILAAGSPWGWPPFLSLFGKFGTGYARRVTDELIEQIRSGVAPWQKPWEPGERFAPEKGTQVLFWTQQKSRFITRQYTVFNIQQADGISLQSLFGQPPPEWATHGEAERIVRGSGVLVQHVPGDRAYYRIDEDQVVLPEPSRFPTRKGYYQTAPHECGHSTGHPDRMGRDMLKKGIVRGNWLESSRCAL